jgi:hypothetical protein
VYTPLLPGRAALEARPWLRVEWLPTFAPELNAIERCWRDLKRHYLANQTFRDGADLERRARAAVHRRASARTGLGGLTQEGFEVGDVPGDPLAADLEGVTPQDGGWIHPKRDER